jgi:TonB family protein
VSTNESEIRDALDREVARRFDAGQMLGGVERRAARVTILAEGIGAHRRGPLGGLPTWLQWAGVTAAFLGAGLGLRSLYRDWAAVEAPVASAQTVAPVVEQPGPPSPAKPDVAALDRPSPAVVPRKPAVPQEIAPPPASLHTEQLAERIAPQQPPQPSGATTPRSVSGVAITQRTPPKPPATKPQPSRAAPVPVASAPLIVTGPTAPALAGLVGGVRVESLRIGSRDISPKVREVRELGATLVVPHQLTFRSRVEAPPVYLLASLTEPQAATLDEAPHGAYYARLFLASSSEKDPDAQGVMGQEGVHVVPLREGEVWGDAEQEAILRRMFGLRSVVGADGASLAPAADTGVAEGNFVVGAGGRLFEVALRGELDAERGVHVLRIGVSRANDRRTYPETRVEDMEATLLMENGRIAIVALPDAFLAISPRFDEFVRSGDADEVLEMAGEIDPPVSIERPSPEYPPELARLRVEGKVLFQAVIRKDGRVDGIQVLRVPPVEGGEYLVEAAARAVRRWRYLPARLHGEPVNVYFTMVIEFTMR